MHCDLVYCERLILALSKKKETDNRKGEEIAKKHRLQMDKAMRLTIYLLCIAPFVAIAPMKSSKSNNKIPVATKIFI